MSVTEDFLRGTEIGRGESGNYREGEQCQSRETLPAERKSTGTEVPVVRRSVSVNVTDAVTRFITDDVGM